MQQEDTACEICPLIAAYLESDNLPLRAAAAPFTFEVQPQKPIASTLPASTFRVGAGDTTNAAPFVFGAKRVCCPIMHVFGRSQNVC